MSNDVMTMDLNSFMITEMISEEDIAEATKQSGLAPVGKFVCICEKVEGLQIMPYSNPACAGVRLIWRVEYATEIQDAMNPKKNKPVDKNEGLKYEGMTIKEDIGLPVAGEPDARRKRRVKVIAAFNLANPGVAFHAAKFLEIQGKRALIDNCAAQSKNKTTGQWEDNGFTKIGKFNSSGYTVLLDEMPKEPEPKTDDIPDDIDI